MWVLWHIWSYLGALDAQECGWQEMHDKLILQTIAKFPQTLVVGLVLEGMHAVRDGRSGNSHDLLREFMNSIMNNLFMTTPVQPARPFANNCSRKGAGLCSSVCLPVCLPVCSHLAFEGNIAIEPDQRVSSTDIDVESRSQSTKRCLLSRNRNPIFVLFRCQQTGRKCYSALRVMAACHRYLHLSAGGTGPIGQSHHCRWATPKPLLVAQRMATSKA